MNNLLHVIQHSLGVDEFGRGTQHRNYFVTGEGSTDHPICMEGVERGLMEQGWPRSALWLALWAAMRPSPLELALIAGSCVIAWWL